VPRKLWLPQVGHVDPFDFRRGVWVDTLHRWFDHWLHGIDNGIMREPMVDIERRVNEWRTYGTWPAPDARKVGLFLREPKPGGRPGFLSRRPAAPETAARYEDDPSQGEREMASGRWKTKPNRLLFATKRMKGDVRLSGAVKVKLRAVVDRVDTNFTALLVDYGKGERVDHEGSGDGMSTGGEESCHGQSSTTDDACYRKLQRNTHVAPYEIVSRGWLDARHRDSLRSGSALTPGETYTFRWEIFAEDYIFEKGHRIGIVIAGSDADYTVPDPEGARVEVLLGSSKVILPIVGGARALGL